MLANILPLRIPSSVSFLLKIECILFCAYMPFCLLICSKMDRDKKQLESMKRMKGRGDKEMGGAGREEKRKKEGAEKVLGWKSRREGDKDEIKAKQVK